MKRITFALIIGFAFALPNIGSAQESQVWRFTRH